MHQWKWTKRVGGGVIAILSLWKLVPKVWDVVDMVWGVPGRIDDSTIWRIWLDGVSPFDLIYPAGLAFGISLVASEWWLPRIAMAIRARRHSSPHFSAQPTSGDSVGQIDNDLASFKACLPHVERCQKLVQPLTGPFGSMNMGLQILRGEGNKGMELIYELGYLTRQLETLGIRHPIISEPDNESAGAISVGIWSMYLTKLEVMIRHDDIAGARQPELLEPAKQPTSDRSDAQY